MIVMIMMIMMMAMNIIDSVPLLDFLCNLNLSNVKLIKSSIVAKSHLWPFVFDCYILLLLLVDGIIVIIDG